MQTAQSLYSSGVAAFRATSFETAVELFTKAIELEATTAKLYDARASAYEKLGKLQDGLLDAKEVIRLLPTSSKGYVRAARLLKQANKYVNADRVLRQGLENVPAKDEKGIADLSKELEVVRETKCKAEFSPLSQLPLEIFFEIISLATLPPPSSSFANAELPRVKPARPNTLVSAMRVCRAWYSAIKSSPRFWSTLRLDGIINQKNAQRKTRLCLQRALGNTDALTGGSAKGSKETLRRMRRDGSSTAAAAGMGIHRLIITAAQDLPSPTFTAILALLEEAGVAPTIREVVLSFVDGSRTTVSIEREATMSTELLVFLQRHSTASLDFLSICTGGRIYPDFDLTTMYLAFPALTTFNMWGNTSSNFVLGLRAPFLRNGILVPSSFSSADEPPSPLPPTSARHLTVSGAVLVADSTCQLSSFPHLTSLELDIIGASIIWELLSAPNLSKYHAVVYGESHIAEQPLPDLATSWARVEDLRIGGAKRLAPRLIGHAISLDLRFDHLRALDLSFVSLAEEHLALFSSDRAPNLETLNLASTTLAPRHLSLPIPQLDALKALNVSHTLWTTDETIRDLVRRTPRLEKLAVLGNAFITGRPVMELVLARMPPPAEEEEEAAAAEGAAVVVAGKSARGARKGLSAVESRRQRYSDLVELRLEGCDKIEAIAVEWLRRNMRPGAVKFQFFDPTERKKGRWERG
ncbi:hypothetical protein JCM1841_004244 [Sporobolomyces salmonicolor]